MLQPANCDDLIRSIAYMPKHRCINKVHLMLTSNAFKQLPCNVRFRKRSQWLPVNVKSCCLIPWDKLA
jgi:hypothetical protein